jgi:threonine dehydrogenase-like Zn-dependent dehydrogenase
MKYNDYQSLNYLMPDTAWAWNMYGAGLENFGKEEQPELVNIPQPADDQLLVRIDSVGLCFSDLKLVKLGGSHPKLYNRDLANQPTRLGHEVALTIIRVGRALEGRYHVGQRLAMQPDTYQKGKSTAYGYTVPGGLIQYHLIGPEVLETDEGACLLPLEDNPISYGAASLLEPWGCVMASYTQRRRLWPLAGGVMWVIGSPGDKTAYQFTRGDLKPAVVVATRAPEALLEMLRKSGARVEERNHLSVDDYAALSQEFTAGKGFDDIILLRPASALQVETAARLVARRGILNVIHDQPLDGKVAVDLGRLHYDYIAFVGNNTTDISRSYGEERNRCELLPQGAALFVGAGGPMGQMHLQRAIELPDGPRVLIATEVNAERFKALEQRFIPLAKKQNRELYLLNPSQSTESLAALVARVSGGQGVDDAVVCVPVTDLMTEAAALMSPRGMLVLFAGVPNGTMAPVDFDGVYLANTQFTGTSGLTLKDQRLVLERARQGALSPERSIAAIGGMFSARQGMQALADGTYPGKIVIYPLLKDLPLLGLDELTEKLPAVAQHLGPDLTWTVAAEQALYELYWNPQGS